MNPQDAAKVKAALKNETKNALIQMLIKSAYMVDFYKTLCDELKKNNDELKGKLNNSQQS